MQRVAVLGGGVAGLTAADELSQRNFEVDVFEQRDQLGGKARSFLSKPPLPGLPAEHGFRFVPGFYRHLPDTMRKIPYQGHHTVYDNLVEGRDLGLLWPGEQPTVLPSSAWGFLDPEGVKLSLSRHPFIKNFDLTPGQITLLADRLHHVLGSCRERRLMEFEAIRWWDFSKAAAQAENYQRMIRAMTRSLVAARADEMSARTGGDILVQLQMATYRLHGHPDRLLNGPTSDVWIEPWRQKLANAGVRFHFNHEVAGFDLKDGKLAAIEVKTGQGRETLTNYDWFVCALPVEVMRTLVDAKVTTAAPTLANLGKLIVRWMNGFMLYLRANFDMVKGHCIYVDSPWALTSVSQAQFWLPEHRKWQSPGLIEGILSIDISDWESTPGDHVKKLALDCSPTEIRDEVVWQLRRYSKGSKWESLLDDNNIAGYFIDPDIVQPNPSTNVNLEPLFINTDGSWDNRPDSKTGISNLFLASDYVRTNTDLATMEGANEAARRAVNYLLEEAGSTERRCELWPLHEPGFFSFERHADRSQYKRENHDTFLQAREMLDRLRAIDSVTD
jgi:uncharacterized protein with NAD-binding domain and iron-sulfur cluster